MYDLLHKRKTAIMEKDKTRITMQILLAIQFLHRLGIVHRDIKSHNILLNSNFEAKLCDFGLAKHKVKLIIFSLNSTQGQCSIVVLLLIWLNKCSLKKVMI